MLERLGLVRDERDDSRRYAVADSTLKEARDLLKESRLRRLRDEDESFRRRAGL